MMRNIEEIRTRRIWLMQHRGSPLGPGKSISSARKKSGQLSRLNLLARGACDLARAFMLLQKRSEPKSAQKLGTLALPSNIP